MGKQGDVDRIRSELVEGPMEYASGLKMMTGEEEKKDKSDCLYL